MKNFNVYFLLVVVFLSCSKDDATTNSNPENVATLKGDFEILDNIDSFSLVNKTQYSGKKSITYQWFSSCDTIKINASGSVASFRLPKLSSENKFIVKLIVSDGVLKDTISKEINLPIKSFSRIYGLGSNLIKEKFNDTNYNWYFNQMDTGVFSFENCGPTAVTMAIKWADKDFTKTPQMQESNTKKMGVGGLQIIS